MDKPRVLFPVLATAFLLASCKPSSGQLVSQISDSDPELEQRKQQLEKSREVFAPALGAIGAGQLHVKPFDSLLLFSDEGRETQELIAGWASSVGFKVISVAASEEAIARGARGEDLEGESCGPQLSRRNAIARWLPELGAVGYLYAYLKCEKECTIQLQVHLNGKGTEFFAAPFDVNKPWREELRQRLDELVDNGGHNRHGHLNNPVATSGVERTPSTTELYPDKDDRVVVGDDQKTASALCDSDGAGFDVLVDESGQRPRCERIGESKAGPEADQTESDCVCEMIAAAQPTREDKRGRYVFAIPQTRKSRATKKTTGGKYLWAFVIAEGEYSEKRWQDRWFFPECDGDDDCYDMGACFVARTEDLEPVAISVSLEFDSNGNSSKVTVTDLEGTISTPERACLTDRLSKAAIPCPVREQASRTASFRLQVGERTN